MCLTEYVANTRAYAYIANSNKKMASSIERWRILITYSTVILIYVT
jgi:hypothetical protein